MQEEKLKLEGVEKYYGAFCALNPTNLVVKNGEFVTLLGPSGSGKTTLLSLIAGINFPNNGRIEINGLDATFQPSRKRDIGVVFQNYALFPHLSVFDNIAFPLRMRSIAEADVRKRVSRALETINLSAVAARSPAELSGGQQQRVAFARCVVYEPSIILMDEPLGALDKRLRDTMQEEIRRLHRSLGTTIVYITHDQTEAMTLSDRICLMNAGEIWQIGSPNEIYFNPGSRFAADFFGRANLLPFRRLETPAGIQLEIPDLGATVPYTGSRPPKFEKGLIVVRPQCVKLQLQPRPADCAGSGVVTDIENFGLYTQYHISLGGGLTLLAQRLTDSRSNAWTASDQALFGWSWSDCSFIPE